MTADEEHCVVLKKCLFVGDCYSSSDAFDYETIFSQLIFFFFLWLLLCFLSRVVRAFPGMQQLIPVDKEASDATRFNH